MALSGDVDADGQIVDVLTRRVARLRACVTTDGVVDEAAHVRNILRAIGAVR